MTAPTRLERKHAAKEALAILTASVASLNEARDLRKLNEGLVGDLINAQGDNLPIVTASIAGMASGLLKSFDDDHAGASARWLANLGRSIEAMAEEGM